MKIAWLSDYGASGGAEISSAELINNTYHQVKQVYPWEDPGDYRDVDLWVIGNHSQLDFKKVSKIKKPIIKIIYDPYQHGDGRLMEYFVEKATIVSVAPQLLQLLNIPNKDNTVFIPSPIDTSRLFETRTRPVYDDSHVCYFGALFDYKIGDAIKYAQDNALTLHVYGPGDWQKLTGIDRVVYHGVLPHRDTVYEMQKYKRLVHLPTSFDACPRVVLEAWLLGLDVVTNELQFATWWIDNFPQKIFTSIHDFWSFIEGVAK